MGLRLPNIIKTTSFWRDNSVILRELKHFRKIVILALVTTLIAAFLEGATVGLISSFLQGLTHPSETPINTGVEWFDRWFLAIDAPPKERLYRVAALILGIIWVRSAFIYWGRYYSRLSEFSLAHRIRKSLFAQLSSLSLGFYSQSKSGEIINTMTNQVDRAKLAFRDVSMLITRSSTLLVYVLSMFLLSWQLSIASIMLYGLLSVGLNNVIRRVREASFAIPQADGKVSSIAIEFINGVRTIQASATQNFERRRFKKAAEEVLDANKKVASISETIQPLAEGAASTILIGIILASFTLFVVQGEKTAASLLTFMFILFRMMPLVSQVNAIRGRIRGYQGALKNIKDLLRKDDKQYLKNGSIEFSSLKESIEFIDVDFGYNSLELVLHGITLKINRGETTALVGSSGAGKTTLVDLIPRFYDPTRGKILIDGIDLKDLDIDSLRRKMAIVSQDTFIFNTSIRDNIAYALDRPAEADIIRAAKLANAIEFIEAMPAGMETILGDRGVRLSGGQRQRIAIARAILRDPEILILDEATSALDSVTERLIQESIENLARGRTVIAIAHRLSTIVRADRVVVLEKGRIVEEGGYQELLDLRGKLWKYHQMQYQA